MSELLRMILEMSKTVEQQNKPCRVDILVQKYYAKSPAIGIETNAWPNTTSQWKIRTELKK